jgi:hypothetical protein
MSFINEGGFRKMKSTILAILFSFYALEFLIPVEITVFSDERMVPMKGTMKNDNLSELVGKLISG